MEPTDEARPQRSWGRFFAVFLAGALVAACLILVTETRSDAGDVTCSMSQCPTVEEQHTEAATLHTAGRTGRSPGFTREKLFA